MSLEPMRKLSCWSGATFVNARRRGKYLLCDLDTGDRVMIHLRMSGRVLIADAGADRPPHTHVVMHLSGRPRQEPAADQAA